MSEGNGRVGRPSKFTAETREKILTAIRNGNFPGPAARAAGIGRRTLCSWLARGKAEPKGEYGAFRRTFHQAVAWAETEALAILSKEARGGDTSSLRWWLATRHARRWSQQREEMRRLEERCAMLEKHLGITQGTPATN